MKAFSELTLKEPLARALSDLGYTTPTPIQAAAIPQLLAESTDFLGLAATGTGKTAAYGIPLLQSIDTSLHKVQVLILCPTRELAKQIDEHMTKMGKYLGVKSVVIYGGTAYNEQIAGIRRGAQVVIATPGRLIDHLEKGTLVLRDVRTVSLDEADEMISMGFKDDLEEILKHTSHDSVQGCNTWLFSATMPPDLKRVADRFLKDPATAEVNQAAMLSGTVEQLYFTLHEDEKPEAITRVIDVNDDFYGLVFCQTKALVSDLCRYFRQRGYGAEELHGDMSQAERDRAYKSFKTRNVNVLVCTDVAARGLDVKDVTHVINYSLPREMESYVHRIGRTGRSGRSGKAISLVTPSHYGLIRRIEHHTGSRMARGIIPTVADVRNTKMKALLQRVVNAKDFAPIESQLTGEWQAFIEAHSAKEVAARMLALTFPDLASLREHKIGVEIEERRHERQRSARNGFAARQRRGGGQGGYSRGGGGGNYSHRKGPRPARQ